MPRVLLFLHFADKSGGCRQPWPAGERIFSNLISHLAWAHADSQKHTHSQLMQIYAGALTYCKRNSLAGHDKSDLLPTKSSLVIKLTGSRAVEVCSHQGNLTNQKNLHGLRQS